MRNKFSNRRGLSYFSTTRIHGNVLACLKAASLSERSKSVIKNILRWEDDGGLIIEAAPPIMSLQLDQTNLKMKKCNVYLRDQTFVLQISRYFYDGMNQKENPNE